jgi:Type II secretion system (T2SS), protein M subtype b
MNGWLWQLRQWGYRLGPAGLTGLGLLAAALLLQTIQVASLQQTTRAQQARLVALQQAAARRAAMPQSQQAANPLSLLPPTGEAAQLIGELERLAHLHGLELPRGQYRVSSMTGTSLQRWQLVLPVKTAYPDLHAFLATALERLPNLTLDELKLKRERIESTELQAELRMSLFVEAAP